MINYESYIGNTAVIFGFLGALAYSKQTYVIFANKTAQSVSGLWTITFSAGFIAFLIYGIQQNSSSMELQGWLRTVFSLPVAVGFFIFGAVSYKHYLLVVAYFVLLFLMYMEQFAYEIFVGLGFLGITMLFVQMQKIHNEGTRGVVSLDLQIVLLLAAVCWTFYSVIREDLPLMIISMVAALANALVIHAWFYNPAR